MTSTPGGNDGLISASFFFTPLMTFKAFIPSRMTTMPATVSPSPCHSAAPSRISAERDRPDITNPHGSAVLCSNGHCFEVAQRTQIPEAANHVLRAAHFEDSPADFIRAGPDLFNDCGERYGVGAQFVRIEIHLVLFDESTNGRDFGDARDRFELVAQIPILNAAQFGQAALMGAIH